MIDIATYVVSDIHGEYELFIRLLEAIHLKEMDTLYVLGDILDRGPHPIRIILKIMEMPNVVCLTGNHELMALECLEFLMQEITEISIEKVDEKMLEEAEMNLAERICQMGETEITTEVLTIIEESDIPDVPLEERRQIKKIGFAC